MFLAGGRYVVFADAFTGYFSTTSKSMSNPPSVLGLQPQLAPW